MSLLPSCNNGATSQSYFIQNIGGAGVTAADAPCIQGTTLGAVRIGNPAAGVIIRGDTLSSNNNRMAGGQVSGGSLSLGNSTTSFQNIVLTDNLTTINTPTAIGNSNGLSIAGNLVFSGAPVGSSISGYYSGSTAVVGSGPVANPAGLTAGLYAVMLNPTNDADRLASPSSVFYFSGTQWVMGNAVSSAFTAGVPNCVISAAAGLATLEVTGTGVPAGALIFSKLAN